MNAILACDAVVEFPIYGASGQNLKKNILYAATGGKLSKDSKDRVIVRALDKVNFEFNEGDRVGLIGHNGSGKSTLLRLLAGVYEPTSGFIEVKGLVTSMLNITMGTDPEATGLENINYRCRFLGMKKNKIAEVIEDVTEFAGLGDFLYLPIRTYSTGMSMRLAFAISTSVDADIILMDEWLSAGDADFAKKARIRLDSLLEKAKIVVIASHNVAMVKEQCNKIIKLEQGKIVPYE